MPAAESSGCPGWSCSRRAVLRFVPGKFLQQRGNSGVLYPVCQVREGSSPHEQPSVLSVFKPQNFSNPEEKSAPVAGVASTGALTNGYLTGAPSSTGVSGSVTMAVSNRELEQRLDLMKAYRGEEYWTLLSYAYKRHRRYQELIIFEDVVDSIYEALDKGVRHLSKSKPRFESLCSILDSKISHLTRERRRYVSLEAAQVSQRRDDHSEVAQIKARRRASAEAAQAMDYFRAQEAKMNLHLVLDELKRLLKDDPLILQMLSKWEEEDPSLKPHELAEILGIDISKIYGAKGRLKRIERGIREERLFKCPTKSPK